MRKTILTIDINYALGGSSAGGGEEGLIWKLLLAVSLHVLEIKQLQLNARKEKDQTATTVSTGSNWTRQDSGSNDTIEILRLGRVSRKQVTTIAVVATLVT